MSEGEPAARRGTIPVVVTGVGVTSAYGRGTEALLAGLRSGQPAFSPVQRFDATSRRVQVAAAMPGSPDLLSELSRAVGEACENAALPPRDRAHVPLFLAIHGDPAIGRATGTGSAGIGSDAFTAAVADRAGLAAEGFRCYTSACVAASSAIADASAMIARGKAD